MFLPDNYELPKSEGNYLEFETGDNRFRILSPNAVTGWLYWTDSSGTIISNPVKGCQVVHVRSLSELPKEVLENRDLRFKPFWLFTVFSRNAQQIQICKLTQSSIMRGMEAFINSEEWSDPTTYDFVVTKQGEGLATTYTVRIGQIQPLDEGVIALYRDLKIDLTAYLRGENPFGRGENGQAQLQHNENGAARPPVQGNRAYVAR